MASSLPPLVQKLIDKFSNSRDFTVSVALHAILVAVFSSTILIQAVKEPSDFEGGSPGRFVETREDVPPPQPRELPPTQTTLNPADMTPPSKTSPLDIISTSNPQFFSLPPATVAPRNTAPVGPTRIEVAQPSHDTSPDGLTPRLAAGIKRFTEGWGPKAGPGVGLTSRVFKFTAYIGKYRGGNWDSTVRMVQDKIVTGSLPNLLYLMSAWSKDKIETNYKKVEAIQLDSDQLFVINPPFIFFTGTRDFILTDKEVENLQKYVRVGGCIWGDSSLPGLRSRFDIAFRREMKRVIPDVDKNFEPLPASHPIFTQSYFTDVKGAPPGLNFYQEPIMAMKIYGEIAILYTANDYGDMWQVGLDQEGSIDMRRDQNGHYVAINPRVFSNREVYLRNINKESLNASFRFGTNVVIHLLTRWEDKLRTAPTL